MLNYELNNNIATLSFDDGKVNVVSHKFLDNINAGHDRAEEEKVGAVILQGREGMFAAGFDLGEFKKGPEAGQSGRATGLVPVNSGECEVKRRRFSRRRYLLLL